MCDGLGGVGSAKDPLEEPPPTHGRQLTQGEWVVPPLGIAYHNIKHHCFGIVSLVISRASYSASSSLADINYLI
eukprot:COSAG05_NODE_513_length_9084_cov_5.373957_12_plen_74_part_00